MKILKGKMLVQDMNLKPGEIFKVGAFRVKYVGRVKRNGEIYDKLVQVSK